MMKVEEINIFNVSFLPAWDKHIFFYLLSKQKYSFPLQALNYPLKLWKIKRFTYIICTI